jgi:hypothetical protein
MSGLQAQLVDLARRHQGRFVSHRVALESLLGVPPGTTSGPGLKLARAKVYYALGVLAEKGTLTTMRGKFALAGVAVPEDETETTTEAEALPLPVVDVAVLRQFNDLAQTINTAFAAIHEALSDTRRAVNIVQAATDATEQPTGFRLTRYSSTSSTVTMRRRER